MKAALIDNNNNVVNVIVWDDTCIAPEGLTAVVLEDNYPVQPNFIKNEDGTFYNPNPPQEVLPKTAEEKLEMSGLTVDELKQLLGLNS